MSNFTVLDIAGATQAMFGFAALLVAPGYVAARTLDLFGFGRRSLLERLAWAVALSFAISPIVIELLGRVIGVTGVAIGFGIVAVVWLALLVVDRRELRLNTNRHTLWLALFVLVSVVVIVGELVDIQSGNRLFLSVTVLDQSYRVEFVNAIVHTGIPPLNPFFHPGAPAPMRYYYFWYALCAVCMKIAHVSARQALIASSVWSGLGLTALIALFAQYFLEIRERLHRFVLIAALLLMVTGLDIMPVLYNLIADNEFSGDLEWWSTDQIASWLDSVLWVPNHVAALLCCLAAFLLLWRTREKMSRRDAVAAIILAGVAAASSFGLSVYVAAGFAMVMTGWAVEVGLRERDFALLRRIGAAATIAFALAIPFLRELSAAPSATQDRSAAGPAHVLEFSFRQMVDPTLLTSIAPLAALRHSHPVLLDQSVRLLFLLPGYAIELGVFGMVLVLALIDRRRLDFPRRNALWLAVGGLLLVSVVRSAVIGNNDFGYRAALLPCFLLLLLTADKLAHARPRLQSQVLTLLIVVGLASTGFQAVMLRIFVPMRAAAHMPAFATLPELAFDARTAYAAAGAVMPPRAILQASLESPPNYVAKINLLYAQRAMVTDAEPDCGAAFGGDPSVCLATQEEVRRLFASPAPSAEEAVAVCARLGAGYLAVAASDPAWKDMEGWVWALPLAVAQPPGDMQPDRNITGRFRVVNCSDAPGSLP